VHYCTALCANQYKLFIEENLHYIDTLSHFIKYLWAKTLGLVYMDVFFSRKGFFIFKKLLFGMDIVLD